mgnify:CR=1 FL=1
MGFAAREASAGSGCTGGGGGWEGQERRDAAGSAVRAGPHHGGSADAAPVESPQRQHAWAHEAWGGECGEGSEGDEELHSRATVAEQKPVAGARRRPSGPSQRPVDKQKQRKMKKHKTAWSLAPSSFFSRRRPPPHVSRICTYQQQQQQQKNVESIS